MKVAGGSVQYANEGSLDEFIRQSDNYRHSTKTAESGANLIYNGGQGAMLSHPFPIERLRQRRSGHIREYRQIRQGIISNRPPRGSQC